MDSCRTIGISRSLVTDMTKQPDEIVLVLNPYEAGVVASLVRVAIRKRERSLQAGSRQFGDQWDPTRVQARLDLLTGLYERLGRDPNRISR